MLHDLAFSAESFVGNGDILSIVFDRLPPGAAGANRIRMGSSGAARYILTVRNVRSIVVHDEAHITEYDLLSIEWQPEQRNLVITANEPFAAVVTVSALDIELQSPKV